VINTVGGVMDHLTCVAWKDVHPKQSLLWIDTGFDEMASGSRRYCRSLSRRADDTMLSKAAINVVFVAASIDRAFIRWDLLGRGVLNDCIAAAASTKKKSRHHQYHLTRRRTFCPRKR